MQKIEILYEDQDIVVIDKPPGLPTQAGQDPRRPHLYGLLQEQRGEKLFLHHRLDRDTSGVLLLGRHPRANKGLTDLFREHRLEKVYWALTRPGSEPVPAENGEVVVRDHLAPVRGQNRQLTRMVRVKSGGWSAETRLRLLESLGPAEFWEARPLTGRTHQIRVHLAGLKRPILGDPLYGGKSTEVPRLLLHARSLRFRHPVTGAELTVESPVPRDFQTLLEKWKGARG